jgi:hypothetical protein
MVVVVVVVPAGPVTVVVLWAYALAIVRPMHAASVAARVVKRLIEFILHSFRLGRTAIENRHSQSTHENVQNRLSRNVG